MILRRLMLPSLLSLLLCALCPTLSEAQKSPDVTISKFANLPTKLFFFEDATSLLYHDANEGNVFVSHDEGKQWTRASDIPRGEASMLVEHPFDSRTAFVLSQDKKHWRTQDRGKTWHSFEMPLPPAYVANPLSFHSDKQKSGYILYQGERCESTGGWSVSCHDETYYTKDSFSDEPRQLLSQVSRCQFAHGGKDFKHSAPSDLIFCVAFDTATPAGGMQSLSNSRLFSSTDFFQDDSKIETLGIGKRARGVVAIAVVAKFAVVAIKDVSPGGDGEMLLYVSVDAQTWAQAKFPHASSAKLKENAYTIVESTTHSLGVDVVLQDSGAVGTLFVSNSNGTYFTESLPDTNRNAMGFVDFEQIYGVEGVGLANIVSNAQEVEGRRADKKLQSRITFDDGRTWASIRAPSTDDAGNRVGCNPHDTEECALHFHSITLPHNFGRVFSSPAPGIVMGVGSVGEHLQTYEESDTFLSTDAGVSWKMVKKNAHLYESGDSGSVLVLANDEEAIDSVEYSLDLGKSWKTLDLGMTVKARALTTAPDSTSQKFLLIGQLPRKDQVAGERFAAIFLDFASTRSRQCGDRDFERWEARTAKGKECLMGHKQWYNRRKPDADCYVGDKFKDPVEHEDHCACDEDDYECDFNYIRQGEECVAVGPEPIPAGVCSSGDQNEKYMGSSGYRLIPGNTCNRSKGKKLDDPIEKSCSQAQPPEGEITHRIFSFPSVVVEHAYFKDSTTILVRLMDGSVWQSSNEGYTWREPVPNQKFLVFYMHSHSHDRAYLITTSNKYWYTTDTGKKWYSLDAKAPPNSFGVPVLQFQPSSDYLIWTGNVGCDRGDGGSCHAEAWYTPNNGRDWYSVEKYVRQCQWARDEELPADKSQILCESYRDKHGPQKFFGNDNPLQLVSGTQYFRQKKKLFDRVVGFAKFSEYLVVAEELPSSTSLDLQVSLDGRNFATGMFPPTTRPDQHAYTILESSTDSLFMHITTTDDKAPPWGSILKSNWNGTYFTVSEQFVNRDSRGYVDFEKMIGLDGIALINVVANPADASISRGKQLQSRISHNDGGSWKRLVPPSLDSMGQKYECDGTECALHVHGYTERRDPRATYSTPSVPGLLMAVGNVGEGLARYTDSDTFLSRDAGFTWEEVHKDAHMWEFGDSGSILVMANDEEPTDHVLFTTDEGATWREYAFSGEKIRVSSIVTVPTDTSRRFILFGTPARSSETVALYLDFTSLTRKQCQFSVEEPGQDDFELWSPSEERQEICLFGRQILYHRRKRDANCVVGNVHPKEIKIIRNCECERIDFECEFNYEKNSNGDCVLTPGLQPLPNDDHECRDGSDYWYERTAYRRIPYSSCEGGKRLDRGQSHVCRGLRSKSASFWWTIIMIPFAFTALVGYWYYRRTGMARGHIRLPGDTGGRLGFDMDSGPLATLASVPWFLLGLAGIAWEYVISSTSSFTAQFRSRGGYRNLPVDEDAQILRFEDED